MANVNAPAQLAKYAEEKGVELSPYSEALRDLRALGKFIDPEPPFAGDVLTRLQAGMRLEDAVAEARAIAIGTLTK